MIIENIKNLHLDTLAVGSVAFVETRNRIYRLEKIKGDLLVIFGHPDYCPIDMPCSILGMARDGTISKDYLSVGGYFIFSTTKHLNIYSSTIVSMRIQ